MSMQDMTRRAFLAAATSMALLAGCATSKPNTAKVVPRRVSPNGRLNIACIGVGGKGRDDTLSCAAEKELANIVALCDVDDKNAEESFYRLPDAKRYKDYRKMLEEMDREIDAVTVTTPDHTHAPAAYMAMKMGKHVRVQKPLTHTIAEARLLARTAKETGVVTAMGNQGHCSNAIRELCEIVWSGAIGDVKEVHAWTDRPIWPQGIEKPLDEKPVRATMDWDLWLGAAPARPYNPGYAPFKWRGWWDFGCGAIGDMACHILDAPFWALELGAAPKYSVDVVSQEGITGETPPKKSVIKYEFPQRKTERGVMPPVTVYWYDGKILPRRPEGIPEDEVLGDKGNGSFFIGTKGVASSGSREARPRLLPASRMKNFTPPEPVIPRIDGENSYRHWIRACTNGTVAQSDFSYAGPLTEVANMGNVALRAGKKIEFDVASMRITNDKKANQYLTKKYRKGFDFMPL